MRKERLRSIKSRLAAVGILCADYETLLYPKKLALTSPTGCCRSVGKVRLQAKGHGVLFCFWCLKCTVEYAVVVTMPFLSDCLTFQFVNEVSPSVVFQVRQPSSHIL
jgi:hypothetical protein